MRIRFLKLPLMVVLSLLMLNSCVSRQEIVYFQGLEETQEQINENQAKNLSLKPNDLITVSVTAAEQEAAMPFNLPVVGVPIGNSSNNLNIGGQRQMQTYLVDEEGNIEFPVLGTVKVEGLNRRELAIKLKEDISAYVQDPIVNVRLVNFQVSVLGEVTRPGTFDVRDEYLSLPKALGLANDMTIYGRRDNVLVVREEGGKKTYAYLDLSDASVLNSPYYYLKQNDVVYVEPNKPQRQSASYNRNASVYISIASVLVSLAVLLTR